MKISSFTRHAAVAIAAAVLTGCGGSQSGVPLTNAGMPSELGQPAKGGMFNGAYSGTRKTTGSCAKTGYEAISYSGKGTASFLGPSSESGGIKIYGGGGLGQCKFTGGSFTLTSSKHPTDKISLSVSPPNIMGNPVTYTITGGSGRFAKATGSGTWSLANRRHDTYSDKWSGSISF